MSRQYSDVKHTLVYNVLNVYHRECTFRQHTFLKPIVSNRKPTATRTAHIVFDNYFIIHTEAEP